MFEFKKQILMLIVLAVFGQATVFAEPATEELSETLTIEEVSLAPSDEVDSSVEGKKKPKKVKDPNRGRILPIPIFITEPAIGEGFGLALAYFHRKKDEPGEHSIASMNSLGGASKEQAPPPTVTGVMGAYTNNETRAVGIGHMNSFKDDHIRFTGVAALADVNSTFYLLDHPLKFNLEGSIVYSDIRFRFGDSKWFWGMGLSYLDASTAFLVELPEDAPVDLLRSDISNTGLSAKIAWDSRDNTSMPNTGRLFDLALWRYDEAIGGDSDYWDVRMKLLSFHQLHEKFVLGLRLDFAGIDGNAPFFAIPWVSLRGIPAMRYQGDRVGVFEVEGRYNIAPRWALLGFAGLGSVSSKKPAIDTEQSIYSYGLGGRYQIFEAQNIWVGIDIARGPEDTNWYIQVGHAW